MVCGKNLMVKSCFFIFIFIDHSLNKLWYSKLRLGSMQWNGIDAMEWN